MKRRGLVLGVVVAVGMAAVVLAQSSRPANMRTSDVQVSTDSSPSVAVSTPAATPTPHVTVNGQSIPVGASGHASVTLPGGTTHVEVSDGTTTVTTTNPAPESANSAAGNNGGVNLHMDSTATSTSGSSSSFSSSSTFSTSSAYSMNLQ
jgi:hypothetical protein